MRKPGLIATILCAGFTLASCGQMESGVPISAFSSSEVSSSEPAAPSSSDEEISVPLDDLSVVTKTYVTPLMSGDAWKYSWETVSDIAADDLIDICAYNNFLNLPRDSELVYETGDTPAAHVESALQERFDVSTDYLKTSKRYNTKTDTYELIGGFGGACRAVAISAEQKEQQVIIEIGILCAISESELMEMGDTAPSGLRSSYKIMTPKGILVSAGKLTIEVKDENVIKYISYQLNESFSWN